MFTVKMPLLSCSVQCCRKNIFALSLEQKYSCSETLNVHLSKFLIFEKDFCLVLNLFLALQAMILTKKKKKVKLDHLSFAVRLD